MNVSKVDIWKAEMFADGKPRWIIDIYDDSGEGEPIKIVSKTKPVIESKIGDKP
jgi:hypothetical protein